MTIKTKLLLGISLSAFVLSATGVLWGLFLPVGAITFGLFMIFKVLEKASGEFDREQQMRIAYAEQYKAARPAADNTAPNVSTSLLIESLSPSQR